MNDPILKVEHLSMKFGGLVAIGDLSFEARRGEITALIGPNGAGKTTVFNCITGFYKPSEGMITLTRKGGEQLLLERMPDFRITAKAKVARTFQNIRLFSGMTVLENLLVAQHNKLMLASGFTVLGLLGLGTYKAASAESIELAKFWLEKANLVDRADDPAGDLSYGAQRRLEIARAMCTEPELLCLDEPAAGLNPRESAALNLMLNDIKENSGASILLIEHDMSVVMQISDHVVVLEYGRKISDGDPISVKADPRVIAAYLGVDDEEVEEVLVEVGDEQVIEQLDAEPDRAHGPSDSSSMMAGSVSDTISHSDDYGERITVSRSASKADQVDRRAAKAASTPPVTAEPVKVAKAPGKAKTVKPAASAKPATNVSRPTAAEKTRPATKAAPAYGLTGTVTSGKPAPAAKSGKAAAAKPSVAQAAPAKPKASAKPAAAKSVAGKPAAAKPAAPKAAAAKPKADAKKPAAAKKAPALSNTLKAPRGGKADRLILIKGIGPVNEKKLNQHGIYHFDQIAAWKKADIEAAEAYLAFDGRIEREDWMRQAKELAKQGATKPAAAKRGGRK
ncbi:ATP-binding cassette domain-containing protein [Mesorhizobium sp. ZC-5]|uniref:ATP-binding cassette domain-containing protein n=1 Tax=Mesorhizobium sp. ZC-5 TaxID=2986066 RepID=UPI0021E86BD5|nr:ATP-binding cassette domain-containing protein [Mesorhizobium sp. ZC-5]MCV3238915.1 ATP-binding cassette domain-containing protein [Mesorhizobium sp. ZC-5]